MPGLLLAPVGLAALAAYSLAIELTQLQLARLDRACDVTDLVGKQGAARACVIGPPVHSGLEEGAVHDELATPCEQVEQAQVKLVGERVEHGVVQLFALVFENRDHLLRGGRVHAERRGSRAQVLEQHIKVARGA